MMNWLVVAPPAPSLLCLPPPTAHPTPEITPHAKQQVGLFELLKAFGVFPDVVLGHSAGEVPAAYAAGLLTLAEAVQVVYHRSTEQQKMAGCGRLLVVGMNVEKVRALLEKAGGDEKVEVACVNSGESTVLAASEGRLLALKESVIPASVATTFVEGNIAFHSSRMEPILPAMRARLAGVLGASKGAVAAPTWSLPFVSTVTGRVEGKVDAEYWCVLLGVGGVRWVLSLVRRACALGVGGLILGSMTV
jgi:acyl transferase domain-containing protein